jgi:hypothetical protein
MRHFLVKVSQPLIVNHLQGRIRPAVQPGVAWFETRFKQSTRSATGHLVMGTLADLKPRSAI